MAMAATGAGGQQAHPQFTSENIDPVLLEKTKPLLECSRTRNTGLRGNDSWRNQNRENFLKFQTEQQKSPTSNNHDHPFSLTHFPDPTRRIIFQRELKQEESVTPTDKDVSLFINKLLKKSQLASPDDETDFDLKPFHPTTNLETLKVSTLESFHVPNDLPRHEDQTKHETCPNSQIWKASNPPYSIFELPTSRFTLQDISSTVSLNRPALTRKQESTRHLLEAPKFEFPRNIPRCTLSDDRDIQPPPEQSTHIQRQEPPSSPHVHMGEESPGITLPKNDASPDSRDINLEQSALKVETPDIIELSMSANCDTTASSLFTQFGCRESGSPLTSPLKPKISEMVQIRDINLTALPGEIKKTSLWFGTNSIHPPQISTNIICTQFDTLQKTVQSKDLSRIFTVEQDTLQKLRNVTEFIVSFQPASTGLYTALLHIKSRKKSYIILLRGRCTEIENRSQLLLEMEDKRQVQSPIHFSQSNSKHIYFGQNLLRFNNVRIGRLEKEKVTLCNGCDFQETVIISDPEFPFAISHHEVSIPPRSYIRLPVRVVAVEAGEYRSLLRAKTLRSNIHLEIELSVTSNY